MNYWFVGAFIANEDNSEEFIKDSKWFDGHFDDTYRKELEKINEGDIFILKSTFRQEEQAKTRIKAIGKVQKRITLHEYKVKWFKLPQFKDFDTWISKTIQKLNPKNQVQGEILNYIIKFLEMEAIKQLLSINKNLILHGAPGTGKTYLAKELAKILTNGDENRIGFVQFHPSYDYTDFIEGLKPSEDKDKMFELKNGIFREFCNKAAKADKNTKFVFIIDEINRGDISKIFGEVFYSIEPGYRGEKGAIATQYSYLRNEANKDSFGKEFYVPENVYIIGTMNDIDRSVETFDFAIRRRFVWYEVKILEKNGELTEEAKEIFEELKRRLLENKKIENEKVDEILKEAEQRLKNLNKKLESKEIGLGSTYHIGPAYFLNLEKYYDPQSDNKAEAFDQLWNFHLRPLLHEYVRTLDDPEGKLDTLKKAYDNEKVS